MRTDSGDKLLRGHAEILQIEYLRTTSADLRQHDIHRRAHGVETMFLGAETAILLVVLRYRTR